MKDDLSNSTLCQYEGRIKKVQQLCPLTSVAQHFERIDALYPNIQTRKGCYTALLWKLRQLEKDKPGEYTSQIGAVTQKFNDLKEACNKQANEQELTPNQLTNYMSYTDLLTLYNKATSEMDWESEYSDKWLHYTLVALYTIQPPVRADYWDMSFVQLFASYPSPSVSLTDTHKAEYYAKDQYTDKNKNYCIITPTDCFFVFNTYKTAQTYGQRIVKAEWIIGHLLRHLCENLKRDEVVPIKTPNALVKAVKKAFAHFGGKETSIGLLRHAYIVEFYKRNPSIAQKDELAKKMLHSRSIQECYRSQNVLEDEV